MKEEYVVKKYMNPGDPEIVAVTEEQLWEILQEAKDGGLKIAVYKLGNCVLDWS